MRCLASLLLLLSALPALAADVWRWKDDQGVVHYSDTQVPGAERVTLPKLPQPAPGSAAAAPQPLLPSPPVPVVFAYSECSIAAPGKDQTFNGVNEVTASLKISPPLLRDHRIAMVLDTKPYLAWPERMFTFKIEKLNRGEHVLLFQVMDENKKPVCTSPEVHFYVRLPSVLLPGNPNKPKP